VAPSGQRMQSKGENLDWGGGGDTSHCLQHQMFGLAGGCKDFYLSQSEVGD